MYFSVYEKQKKMGPKSHFFCFSVFWEGTAKWAHDKYEKPKMSEQMNLNRQVEKVFRIHDSVKSYKSSVKSKEKRLPNRWHRKKKNWFPKPWHRCWEATEKPWLDSWNWACLLQKVITSQSATVWKVKNAHACIKRSTKIKIKSKEIFLFVS